MRDILVHVTRVKDERRALKLAYLNNFVRLCCYLGNQHAGFAREDILCCLRLGLLHQAKEIRTATLRALRYYIRDKQRLRALLSLQIDLLIVRSLDLVQDNEGERIQVLRLIRKMMSIDPATFPRSLLNAVVAIAGDGGHDRLVRCCLATICELAVYNPEVVARAGGVGVLMKCILDASMPGINEAMVATVLHLLNNPRTRPYIRNGVDIEQVLAPFTDFHYKHNSIAPDQEASESEDQELRFVACKQAIVTMLRSWPGMIRLCKKNDSGIRSVVKVLSLPYEDIRKHFIDVLFEVFRIPALEWTDDFSDALLSLDPSSMRDGWQLMEGFVVEEGLSILPHRASTRMNLVENYLSLLITAFVQAGLLEALVEVIISAGRSMAVATTILLGELLHVGNRLVPVEVSAYSQCLPTLTGLAASPNKSAEVRLRAREVVGYLKRLHDVKKRGVVPCSLYLDQILQLAPRALQTSSGSRFNPGHLAQTRLAQTLERDAEEVLTQAIKDSQVLVTKENFNWDWDLIAALLKWPGDGLVSIDRASGGKFVTRVSYFFSPRSMLFSTIDQGNDRAQLFSVTACYLLEFLLIHDEPEYQKILEDFLAEILDCLKEVCREHVTGSLVLSPQSLLSTLSRDYFLLIGRLSYSLRGEKALSRAGIFLRLMDLVSTTTHDVYVKLVVSSLSYNRSGIARTILSRILTGGTDSCRVYATQHLRVLLRAHVLKFDGWGVDMLVQQLYDKSKAVSLLALDVLDEAAEDEATLARWCSCRRRCCHLGNRGSMLMVRFLSTLFGYKYLTNSNFCLPGADQVEQDVQHPICQHG
ncbi:PREDICTED: rapamycin-insensitive companion of mTOR-like [Priapulus caudatus]|uniref:Rapamycin-insensitive companion of mTOR-like n=1 Tax=Priapulus caudatus TaxID=37621 RepID=A0ABM1DXH4_PRICU|nr:PREDICTED: rapamycin-insensitive companion of mTOR-like [Priapulus caudatus]